MESLTAYLNRKINVILGQGLLENVVVDIITVAEKVNDSLNKEGLILELKERGINIPGVKHYTYRIDPQQGEGGPGRQRHIHIFYDGEQSFAMNLDGTAHDCYHQVKISDDIVSFLKGKGFTLPNNNIIELKNFSTGGELICENSNLDDIVFTATRTISRIRRITIFESNEKSYQAIWQAKKMYNYQHVNKLANLPQDRIAEIKSALIGLLKSTGKYCDDVNSILDGTANPISLYVAWDIDLQLF